MKQKVNFKQPKYIIGIIVYLGSILIGGLIFNLFDTEIEEPTNGNLVTTEYLNSDLPAANIKGDLSSKRKATQDVFGNITDYSGVQAIENDLDSIKKKEDYTSKYSEEELQLIEEQKAQQEEIKRLKEMNAQLQAGQRNGHNSGNNSFSGDEYSLPLTAADRERLASMRRNGQLAEMERDLSSARQYGEETIRASVEEIGISDSIGDTERKIVTGVDDEAEAAAVVKKVNASSSHFNTLSDNTQESHLINAIVDEEIKVVDGSRVRLRVLDEIEIDGITLKKGSYMYATMSGFSQQRIQGTVKSVMIGDDIHKINLSIYDTDGLEGLYVPASSFRETAQDVGSSALSNNMSFNNGTSSGNSVAQWAMQGVQNAYQRTSNAIAKAIKKNKVRIKYGTRVYLINTKEKKK